MDRVKSCVKHNEPLQVLTGGLAEIVLHHQVVLGSGLYLWEEL